MANQLAEEVKKAEQVPPSDEQLRKELAAERTARQDAEQRAGFYQGAASAEWNRAEAARTAAATPPPGTITDPFAKLAAEDPLLDPEKRARLLDEGARGRAREEIRRYAQEDRAQQQMQQQQMEARLALRMFQSSHPELAADEEGFAAAMTRAKIRSDGQRMTLDPMGMLQLGMQIYNEGKGPAPGTPFTEAPGTAGAGGVVSKKDEPAPLSMAEEVYGATDFIDERKVPLDAYTEKFLDERNLELVDKGKFWSGIRNVVGDLRAAKGRRAAGR